MTDTQFNNIIRFSFNFHSGMGCKIHEFSPEYIREKWSKYIGDLKPVVLSDELKKYSTRYRLSSESFQKWRSFWGEPIDELNIINLINCKSFKSSSDNIWLASDLINLFSECLEGSIDLIRNVEYLGLHKFVEDRIDDWIEVEEVNNDYSMILRNIKIEEILK